jgi:hypothetical protein
MIKADIIRAGVALGVDYWMSGPRAKSTRDFAVLRVRVEC